MNQKLEKALKKKFNYFNRKNKNSFFFLVSRGRFSNDLGNIIGSIALNKTYKIYPVVISDDYKKSYNKIFKVFGLKLFQKVFRYHLIFKNPIILLLSIFHLLRCIINTYLKNFEWLIKDFNIKTVKVGDLIYDTYIRYNYNYVNPKIDLTFINIAFKSIFRTLKSFQLTKKFNPKLILIGTDFYGHNNGIMMRIGITKKISVFECQPQFLDINYFSDIKYGKYHLKSYYHTFKKIDKKIINRFYSQKVNNKLKGYKGRAFTDIYYHANRFKNQNLNKKKFLSKNFNIADYKKYKKIILLAPHVFADAPHLQGNLIFRDFYDEFKETLKIIYKSLYKKDILWISKIHPAAYLYGEEKVYKKLIEKYKFPNLIDCPKNINSRELISICDNVITSKGSIGLEFAAEGKLPILGGIAAYSHLGFSYDSKNKNDFFSAIKKIEKIKPLTIKQIITARTAMYHLDKSTNKIHLNDKNSVMQNFMKMKDQWFDGLSKNENRDDQSGYIISSLNKITKNSIYSDPYFKSIENAFQNCYKN